MAKNIILQVREIADAYALEALYHELKKAFPSENIYFQSHKTNESATRKVIKKYPFRDTFLGADLVIRPYSDVTAYLNIPKKVTHATFSIDAAILKACKNLPTPSKEKELREDFDFSDLEKPLVVFGNAPAFKYTKKIITELSDYAHIAVVPHMGLDMIKNLRLDKETSANVTEFPGSGKLAKLYAIADLAISGSNLKLKHFYLHNFYEQTQGGPVFLVPTSRTKQYGFKKFVKQGMICLCEDLHDVIDKSKEFLSKPIDKKKHREKWLAHRRQTRKKFLPEIMSRIEEILNSESGGKVFTYLHPESSWE